MLKTLEQNANKAFEVLPNGVDQIWTLPLGMAWFERLSTVERQQIEASGKLTVVVYPDQNLLQSHEQRMRKFSGRWVAFTSEMPPHAEREAWEQVRQQKVSGVLITAQKLQSSNALEHLIKNPKLGMLILEHGHLGVPHINVMSRYNPYSALPELFSSQWPERPPLVVCTLPISPISKTVLETQLGLKTPQFQDFPFRFERFQMAVKCCLTEYQKFKVLLDFIKPPLTEENEAILVICQSATQVLQLQQRLKHIHPSVVLIERAKLSTFPLHQLSASRLKVLHWQIPTGFESLIQQVMLAIPSSTTLISQLVLYTKEDYQTQKSSLSSQQQALKEELKRVRGFCIHPGPCRRVQFQTLLNGIDKASLESCNACDACQNGENSSLWRNLLKRILY
jgi:superfamily II DNA helicase RecQ